MTYITLEVVVDESDNGLLNIVVDLVRSLATAINRFTAHEVVATYEVKEDN
jgi:hypothetical protein